MFILHTGSYFCILDTGYVRGTAQVSRNSMKPVLPIQPRTTVLAVLIIVAVAGFIYALIPASHPLEKSTGSGMTIAEDPSQGDITDPKPWQKGTYMITPLATYNIRAKVLSIHYYRYGRETNLSPVDFAVGWGPMSDDAIAKKYTVTQHDRWSTWRTKHAPIPLREVLLHSANMHMVPPNATIARKLGDVRVGDIIHATGKLIEAQGSDGWTWKSSLSRADEGAQSCEILWVESLEIAHPTPK